MISVRCHALLRELPELREIAVLVPPHHQHRRHRGSPAIEAVLLIKAERVALRVRIEICSYLTLADRLNRPFLVAHAGPRDSRPAKLSLSVRPVHDRHEADHAARSRQRIRFLACREERC